MDFDFEEYQSELDENLSNLDDLHNLDLENEQTKYVHLCSRCAKQIQSIKVPGICPSCKSINSFITKILQDHNEYLEALKPSRFDRFNSDRFSQLNHLDKHNQQILNRFNKQESIEERLSKTVDPKTYKRKPFHRSPTGIDGLDKVLGGGCAEGYVCMIAGPPGAGKSTLITQALSNIQRTGTHFGDFSAFGSAEEDSDAVIETADRVSEANFKIVVSQSCQEMIELLDETDACVWAIDSLMRVVDESLHNQPGSDTQIKACINLLSQRAHSVGIYKGRPKKFIFAIAHGTKSGDMAGPLSAVHDCDGAGIMEHIDPYGDMTTNREPWSPSLDQSKPTGIIGLRVFRKMRKASNKRSSFFQMQPEFLDEEMTIKNPIGGRLDDIDGPDV